ncbi:MAG: carboxypeptidase regulatory-like domain-containing protein [Pyrinomonadaceae bacterium]
MQRILFASLVLCLFAASAFAQTSRGTVSGIVKDPNGAAIAGANVTLLNTETTVSRSTTTNEEGFYRFDAIDLGNHTVTINATGFGELVKTNVIVNANQTSTVDAQLAVGGQQITVDVTAEAGALLQTEAPVRGGNISTRQVSELPFAGRNPTALALTLPGVTTNRTGVGIGTFVINGARGRSNNFLIDGTENNDISVAGQGLQITNPDAIQEVSIQTSNYDAEFGRAGGGVINTITKAGTNEFHGTLSYLLDSRVDDATTSSESFQTSVQDNGLPFGIQNIFSGTIGGPLYLPRFGEGGRSVIDGRNRTFFFVAYQEDRQRYVAGGTTLTTPTAAGRATLQSLFPAGTNPNVDALLNFTANTVGTGAPFFVALGAAPGTTTTSSTTCDASGNPTAGNRPCVQFGTFALASQVIDTNKQGQFRIDHKVSDTNQLSGRFIFDRSDIPNASPSFPGFGADQVERYYSFLVSDTHVFSPVFTNEIRLAYNRIQFQFPLQDPGGPAGTFPRIVFNGLTVSSLGANQAFPQGRTANNYVVQDTATYVRGNHTFRGGVDFLRQISTQAAPFAPRGIFTYAASTGYNSLGNFVDNFGGGGNVQRDFGSAIYFPALYRTAAFFQDRWKASNSLTLTLGLRYEYFGTPFNTLKTPAYTGLFNINPVTFTGPYSEPNQVVADRNNWAPTVGISYSPAFTQGLLGTFFGERKTVIRAGYQIGYDSFFNNIASNAATSSPNLIATVLTSQATAANPRGLASFSAQGPTVPNLNPRSAQTLIAPDLVNPYYQRWSVGLQRELGYNIAMDVSYVGSGGRKLYINEDANPQVRPELRVTPAGYTGPTNCTVGGNITAAQATPGFPAGSPCPITGRLDNLQGTRTVRTNGGSSSYHAGQLEVRRRFAGNFLLTGSYTFSKLISNADEVFVVGVGQTAPSVFAIPAVFGGDRLDRGLSQNDRTHRAAFTYVIESPFFRDQRGFVGHLLGGWQLSGVTTFESGQPFTVANGLDSDGIGGANDRPTYNPAGQAGVRAVPVVNSTTGAITGYVNPDAGGATIDPATARYIVNPAYIIGASASVPRVGNLGRNTERSPGINNWNMNVHKRTRVTEGTSIEFRTEFFNIFNHPQYLTGSVSPFSPTGGLIVTNAASGAAGQFLNPNTVNTDGGGRVIRYQLKFLF